MRTRAATVRSLPASRIIAAVSDACERWSDADFPPRVRATRAVMERLGYSEPVVDFALDRLFGPITAPALRAAIENEIGSIEALDGFAPRAGRPDAFARGVDSTLVIASDSTIGVALWPALFALCAKSNVVVKDRSDDLLATFAESLVEEDACFREAFVAQAWDGSDAAASAAHLDGADVVVAFGRDATLRAIRDRCAAATAFHGFGHRTSAGYLEREALASEALALRAARGAARDAMLYEGEGCLSLHTLFVERGGGVDAVDFTLLLQRACEEASVEFPAVRSDAAAREARQLAAFRAAQTSPLPAPQGYLLTFDAPHDEPPPLIPRSLAVYPVDSPADTLDFLRRHRLPLEAFAVADPPNARADVLEASVTSGAARFGRLGRLQAPEPESNHGGSARILPFVRRIVRDR